MCSSATCGKLNNCQPSSKMPVCTSCLTLSGWQLSSGRKGALWRHLLSKVNVWMWLWPSWLPISLILKSHVGLGGTSMGHGCTSLGRILREGSSCKTWEAVFACKQWSVVWRDKACQGSGMERSCVLLVSLWGGRCSWSLLHNAYSRTWGSRAAHGTRNHKGELHVLNLLFFGQEVPGRRQICRWCWSHAALLLYSTVKLPQVLWEALCPFYVTLKALIALLVWPHFPLSWECL